MRRKSSLTLAVLLGTGFALVLIAMMGIGVIVSSKAIPVFASDFPLLAFFAVLLGLGAVLVAYYFEEGKDVVI